MTLDDPTHENLLAALLAAFLSAILVVGWRLLSRNVPAIHDVKTDYPSADIVENFQHNIYPRIETRKGGPLARASEGKTLLITGASKGIGRVRAFQRRPFYTSHFSTEHRNTACPHSPEVHYSHRSFRSFVRFGGVRVGRH